jgi:D-methionine transport system ATP-binding protein
MIELRNVSKTFERKGMKIDALHDIHLRVEKGDIFGIIGYSGAGKSTLLRMVNALETPTQGEVIINGESLNTYNEKQLRLIKKDIGMIFQHFNLLHSKTVFQNVAIPLILSGKNNEFIRRRVAELLDFVQLGDRARSFPDELSGGQKQRVGIARALATNPSILLCDEATSALDPQTTGQILSLLKRINREYHITIIVITHEMSVIQKICNKVAVMECGTIVEQGPVIGLIQDSLPGHLQDAWPANPDSRRLRLEFVGQAASRPIIYELIKNYDLEINILYASMSEIQDNILGFMMVQLNGDRQQNELAIAHLRAAGVEIQEISPCSKPQ